MSVFLGQSSQAPSFFQGLECANQAERLAFFGVWELGSFARIFFARENQSLARAHVCDFPPIIPKGKEKAGKADGYAVSVVREFVGAWEDWR